MKRSGGIVPPVFLTVSSRNIQISFQNMLFRGAFSFQNSMLTDDDKGKNLQKMNKSSFRFF